MDFAGSPAARSIILGAHLAVEGKEAGTYLSPFYLKEAGIGSHLIKGNLKFYVFSGRHAWNLAWVGKRVALVDVSEPGPHEPFIVWGTSEAEIYERAADMSRSYSPTPDDQNHYKIGT